MRRWLRKLTRRARLEREMEEELAFHVQARVEDLARSGVPEAEARRQARIEFGGVERHKEDLRDSRRFGLLEDAARDLAYAWRNLRRSPIFTLSAAAAIALGIGVNTALFSLVYGVLFRPLPVRDPGTIRNVYLTTRGEGDRRMYGTQYFVSFDEFQFLRSQARTAELAAVAEAGASARFAPAGLHLQLASDNLLPMIGAKPVIGRFFTKAEVAAPGAAPVAVLSYEAWQKYFNGENVAGRSVVLNRTPFTIIGVADERSYGPLVLKPDLWIPLTMQAMTRAGEPLIADANAGWLQVIGRIKPGVADAAMYAELQVLGQQAVMAHAPKRTATVTVAPGAFLNYPDVMSGKPTRARHPLPCRFVSAGGGLRQRREYAVGPRFREGTGDCNPAFDWGREGAPGPPTPDGARAPRRDRRTCRSRALADCGARPADSGADHRRQSDRSLRGLAHRRLDHVAGAGGGLAVRFTLGNGDGPRGPDAVAAWRWAGE